MWDTTHHCLEAGVDLGQEGRLQGQCQDPLLYHGALNIIVLYDDVLLQDLDGVELIRPLPLRQHDLLNMIEFIPQHSNSSIPCQKIPCLAPSSS